MALTYDEVLVTPEIAEQFLATMKVNRPLSEANLNAIMMAMKEDRWHEDGDPIRFNVTGELIDGQHRMWAVIYTEIPQRFLVIHNVRASAMNTLNTGKIRTKSDVLSIAYPDLSDVNNIASAAAMMMRYDRGVRGNSLRNAYFSNDDIVEYVGEHREELHAGVKTARRAARMSRGAMTLQTFSFCAVLFERLDHTDAAFFWERLVDGVGLEAGSPILALRDFIAREAASSRPTLRPDIGAAYIIKAWNAYREGRDVKLLHFRVGGATPERFPEPV